MRERITVAWQRCKRDGTPGAWSKTHLITHHGAYTALCGVSVPDPLDVMDSGPDGDSPCLKCRTKYRQLLDADRAAAQPTTNRSA